MTVILESSHREFRTFIAGPVGVQAVLPVIVTKHGVLVQFARYIHANRGRSSSWQESATFAVRLLLEFVDANHGFYGEPKTMFSAFSSALHTGTISNRVDPSGLWWSSRQPDDAAQLIDHITQFTDWLADVNEDAGLQLNPWRQATRHEERLNWAAYSHRRDNAFLSHLWRSEPQIVLSREVNARRLPLGRQTPTKAFPDEYFESLITEGFRRRARDDRGQVSLRNSLIARLMHYGGLRLSEALSLWSEDVTIEDGEVIVRVHHPESGLAPDGKANRATYLQERYGLIPRNRLVKAIDPLFLGWKNSLITDPYRNCFEVYFYPGDEGVVFADIWCNYHDKQRVKPKSGQKHPYAFTCRNGQPYSHRMYRDAQNLAIDRIGLDYGKLAGTTPHGHRHAYGQRLAGDGFGPYMIKNAMHHASITSSQVYTQPTPLQVREILRDVDTHLRKQYAEDVMSFGADGSY